MNFKINNFFEFTTDGKAKAAFTLETESGMYYDCKLVEGGANGYFIACNQQRSYDKNGGGKRYTTELDVDRFEMLDGKPSEGGQGGYDDYNGGRSTNGADHGDIPAVPAGVMPGSDDDLPF